MNTVNHLQSNAELSIRRWLGPNSEGLCECGCGKRTNIHLGSTRVDKGQIKGKPSRFLIGHQRRTRSPLELRFESSIYTEPNSGCHLFIGDTCSSGGHQLFYLGSGKRMLAHRVAWILAGRELPDDLGVLHHCDNPACVNVDHLFLGTNADNFADMQRKGRVKKGKYPLGVSKKGEKFVAQVTLNLGRFDTMEEASNAVKEYRTTVMGETHHELSR